MNKKIIIFSLAIVFSFLSAIILMLIIKDGNEEKYDPVQPTSISDFSETYGDTDVFLYFGSRTKPFLTAEARKIETQETTCKFAEKIIKALISGSVHGNINTLPGQTKLRALYITRDNLAVVDLSAAVANDHPGGCRAEELSLYSIVNSLTLNIPAIKKVKIIIDGNEAETLAGHIDISAPYSADMLIVR